MAQEIDYSSTSDGVFTTFATLVGIIPLIVESFKKIFKLKSKINKKIIQIFSWVIGIAICLMAWVLDLGIFASMVWYEVLLWGIMTSLASNGVADTKVIKGLFSIFAKKS
jgi:hypothetical protein